MADIRDSVDIWATAQIRSVIAESNLWDYAVHLRRLLERDVATIENAESLEEIRQSFESLLAALKAVVAQKKTKSLTVEAASNFQENQRFSFWLLEQARSLLDKNVIEISKIPRDLAPEKPAVSVPPSTPRPPSTPVKLNPLRTPTSPFVRVLPVLPPTPDAAATQLNLQDSIHPSDSVSKTSSSSSMRKRRKEEEVKVKKDELHRINELEREKERKEYQRQKEEEEKEEAMRKVKEEWDEMEAALKKEEKERKQEGEKNGRERKERKHGGGKSAKERRGKANYGNRWKKRCD